MNDQSDIPERAEPTEFSPSRYYRERRPHLFSDSRKTTKTTLTRDVLSYHLETLTSQKAELAFEGFAIRLVEKFIAPNLRPQTGPIGGGDGKTDAETYPVASAISERWFVPDNASGSERWAFAFSAKRDWRGKVRSDVEAIVETKRGYPRIYFVTNQLVAAKDSAKEQDEFQKKYGIPVTILDRTWLLDHVLEKDSVDIAARTLGVGDESAVTVVGPRDLRRQQALDALEKLLGDGRQYEGVAPRLAEDALTAAELARGLEKPRYEIDGRYERAVRIAREHKLRSHELAAVYGWAWTSHFWFEDAAKLTALYDDVERLAIASTNADDLERLSNLLAILETAVRHGMLTPDAAVIEPRRKALFAALERVRNDASRPNNALEAHSLLLNGRLAQFSTMADPVAAEELWREYKTVIEKAEGLGTFPFESTADLLTEVGEFVPESAAFDELYEALTDALAARRMEGEAAKRNSERGYQKLKKNLPYEAIRWFGRAVSLLVKEEYENELINALMGCSIAYLAIGMVWAARNYALAAATHELASFSRSRRLDDVTPGVLSQLFNCELALGRVPYILSAYELEAIVRNGRSRTDEERTFSNDHRIKQGHRIAGLVLSTKFDDLPRIAKLPDALDRLGLEQVRAALLHLMGREDVLRADGFIPAEETAERSERLFGQFCALAREARLTNPDYMLGDTVELKSRILGAQVVISCANDLVSLTLGEAILGTLEALLATSLKIRTLPHLDRLNVRVCPWVDAPITPSLELVEESGTTVAIVRHAPRIQPNSREDATAFSRWLQDAAMTLFVAFAVPVDVEEWGKAVLGEENGFSRAITFSNVPVMASIIYGDLDRLSIQKWIEDSDTAYETKRAQPWNSAGPPIPGSNDPGSDELKIGAGEPPEGLFDVEKLRHSDYEVISPIDVRKWDAAKWRAVFFMTVPDGDIEPVMALTFMEREPAAAIFQGWRERFGNDDPNNELRISILTGINVSNPHAYAVIVGANVKRPRGSQGKMVGFISRIQTMTPKEIQKIWTCSFVNTGATSVSCLPPATFPIWAACRNLCSTSCLANTIWRSVRRGPWARMILTASPSISKTRPSFLPTRGTRPC